MSTNEAAAEQRVRPVSNVSYLTASNLAAKVISFAFVLYANRALGPALLGNYGTVLSYVGLFGIVTDLGLGTLAVRNVAGNRGLAGQYISNILVLRVLLSAVAIVCIAALAQVMIAHSLHNAVYVYALSLIPLAVTNTMGLVFQFSERLSFSAVLGVVTSAATAILSILALASGHHILALTIVFTVVSIGAAAIAAWLVYTRFLPRRLELRPAWWPELLRGAFPFAIMTVLNIVYSYADRQILQVLSHCNTAAGNAGCPVVGEYTVAYRPLDVLVVVFVGSLNAAILPAFTRVESESRDLLLRLMRSACTLGLIFGVPTALFTTFYATEALHVVGGRAYLVAAPALAVLIWTFPCILLLSMLYNVLYALHRQRVVTMAFAVTLVFNVALNILLIPRYSYMASAALTVASELLNGVIVVAALRRSLGPLGLWPAVLKMSAITLVTALVLWALRPVTIFVGLPIGVLVTLAGIRLTRILGPTERDILGRVPLVGRYVAYL